MLPKLIFSADKPTIFYRQTSQVSQEFIFSSGSECGKNFVKGTIFRHEQGNKGNE